MTLKEFEYCKLGTLPEIFDCIEHYRGKKIFFLAGGTDLLNCFKDRLIEPQVVIDIGEVGELKGVFFETGRMVIGAATTFAELLGHQELERRNPLLFEAVRSIAFEQIRNRATIGGNLAHASPAADSAAALLALDASVLLRSAAGAREVRLEEFFQGPGATVLRNKELLVKISIPLESDGQGVFLKLCQRRARAVSKVTLAAWAIMNRQLVKELRIACGAVAPVPMRARKTEDFLRHRSLNSQVLREARALIEQEVMPVSDIRSTDRYRREMCGVLLERALLRLSRRT